MSLGPLNWFCIEPKCGTRVYEKEGIISRFDPATGKLKMSKLREPEKEEDYNWEI